MTTRWQRVLCSALTSALTLTAALWVGACAPRTPADATLDTVEMVLRERQLPEAPLGTFRAHEQWRVVIDTAAPRRLRLVHQVAGLVLPDGPFTLTEPITYFAWEGGAWRQHVQAKGGGELTPAQAAQVTRELSDTTRVWFYRIRDVDLTASYASTGALAALIRATFDDVSRDVTRALRDGFIAADAEP